MSEWWFGERPRVRGTEEESTWRLNSSLERPGESFLLLAEVDPKVGPEVSGEQNRKAVAGLSLYLLGAKDAKVKGKEEDEIARVVVESAFALPMEGITGLSLYLLGGSSAGGGFG